MKTAAELLEEIKSHAMPLRCLAARAEGMLSQREGIVETTVSEQSLPGTFMPEDVNFYSMPQMHSNLERAAVAMAILEMLERSEQWPEVLKLIELRRQWRAAEASEEAQRAQALRELSEAQEKIQAKLKAEIDKRRAELEREQAPLLEKIKGKLAALRQ